MRLLLAILLASLGVSLPAQAFSLPQPVMSAAFAKAECDVEIDEVNKDLEMQGDLGSGQKLVEVSCWRAAYNFGSIFFALDPAEPSKARLLQFRKPVARGKLELTFQLSNPSFNPDSKLLSSFHKGRGIGDCGTAGEWRWDGKSFVLSRYWTKNNCNGEPFFDEEAAAAKYLVYPARKK